VKEARFEINIFRFTLQEFRHEKHISVLGLRDFGVTLCCRAHNGDLPQLENRFYLADGGYGMRKGILVPYNGVRYHLREQGLASQKPVNAKELFNLRHAQLRNVIERIFGVVKRRFKILSSAPQFSDFKVQVKLVTVLCALHNFMRHAAKDVEDEIYAEVDFLLSESQRVERQQREMEDDVEFGPVAPRLGEAAITSAMERAFLHSPSTATESKKMAQIRNQIAERMWEDYVALR
jgi:hypothetical protein